MPATIGELRTEGYDGLHMTCRSCGRAAVQSFDELGVPQEADFSEVAATLACPHCGSRVGSEAVELHRSDEPTP